MASHTHYVVTDVSPGGDGSSGDPFSGLAEWEATVGASASASDDYTVYVAGITPDASGVTIDFAATPVSITAAANRSHPNGFYAGDQVISDQHYRLDVGNSTICITINEPNVTIDGLQLVIGHTGSFRGAVIYANSSTGAYTTVKNCRMLNTGSTDYGIGTSATTGGNGHTRTFVNNLVVGFDVAGIACRCSAHVTNTWHVYHNTIYGDGSSTGLLVEALTGLGSPTFNLAGNAIANCTGIDTSAVAAGTVNSADNATEDSTGEITGISPAAAWTSPGTSATSDFTVKDTSSPLYNAVNPTILTTDITGFTRDGTNHDVGAFEFRSSGSTEDGDGATSGTGTATGVGASTAASPASASGAGTATGVGASTAASPASASGAGTATGVGSSTFTAAGSASGTGVASATGSSIAAAVGVASGAGSASGSSEAGEVETGEGSASGSAAVVGVGAGIAAAVASASGISTVSGVGAAIFSAVGSASGSSSISGSSESGSIASASGLATVSGVGAAIFSGVGTASGIGSASGAGASTAASVGTAAGTGTGGSSGESAGGEGDGGAGGTGTATGVGASIFSGVGSVSGSASVSGVGASTSASVGSASGAGAASGIGTTMEAEALRLVAAVDFELVTVCILEVE